LLISSVVADACNLGVAAVKEVSTPALVTRIVLPAMPTDADALSLLPGGDLGAEFIDDAGNFVPRNPGILNSRPEAFLHKHVTVANATGLDFDPHLASAGLRNLALDDLEISSGFRNLSRHHCC
jgi:hypothetical protein